LNALIGDILSEAGDLLRTRYRKTQGYEAKARFELVSEADTEVESLLIERLRASYPDDAVFSEESGDLAGASTSRWIVDPIDGSADFIAGVPYFAISIAREQGGAIIEGYVFNPVSNELYHATRDSDGAFLNGEPISVSTTSAVEDALVAFGFSAKMAAITEYHTRWRHVFEHCRKGLPLIVPSLTLCNVARGRLDAFIDFGCSMEGQAAASLILAKAGGTIRNHDLTDHDHRTTGAVAANCALMTALCNSGPDTAPAWSAPGIKPGSP
jgi:myo-inositol-1(or 4)-monophosphatase